MGSSAYSEKLRKAQQSSQVDNFVPRQYPPVPKGMPPTAKPSQAPIAATSREKVLSQAVAGAGNIKQPIIQQDMKVPKRANGVDVNTSTRITLVPSAAPSPPPHLIYFSSEDIDVSKSRPVGYLPHHQRVNLFNQSLVYRSTHPVQW